MYGKKRERRIVLIFFFFVSIQFTMTNETKKPPTLIGSQDLLTYFNLIPIYNKVVKPYPLPNRAAGLDPTLFPYISDLPGKKKRERNIV